VTVKLDGASNTISGLLPDGTVSSPTWADPIGTSGMYFPAANTFAITTLGVNAVYITAGGNVGIQNTSPGSKLTVGGQIFSLNGFKFPDGTIQTTTATPTFYSNTILYNSNATWTKATDAPPLAQVAFIEVWGGGGGGSGSFNTNGLANGSGGGGGGYSSGYISISALGATETITIPAAANAAANGANCSFGSWIIAYGGGSGTGNTLGAALGGGGGSSTARGIQGYFTNPGGAPDGGAPSAAAANNYAKGITGGGAGGTAGNTSYAGGTAAYGGGGGGAAGTGNTWTNGGTSLYGGNGGQGGNTSAQATAGSTPGGGGGGWQKYSNVNPGSNAGGGAGQVRITMW
jgi:hypothetical protein